MKLATSQIKGTSFYDCLDWFPKEKNVFHVIDRESGKEISNKYISDESFFFLNFINCYEEQNEIVIDLVAYDSPEILAQLFLEKLRQGKLDVNDKSKIVRYIIPLDTTNGEIGDNFIKKTQTSASAILNKKSMTLTPHIICSDRGMQMHDLSIVFLLID